MYFQHMHAVREPLRRRLTQITRLRPGDPTLVLLVVIGRPAVDLVLRQDVRFAAESADALQPANEARLMLCHHALQLLARRPFLQILRQLLPRNLFDPAQILPRQGRRRDRDLAANLPWVDARTHAARNLLLIDQPLV